MRYAGRFLRHKFSGFSRASQNTQKFREHVQSLMDSGEKNFAVNLTGVPMLDSSGIGTFVRTHKMLKETGGKLILFAPTKMVRQTLKMVGLERFFGLYEDEGSALAS